jgi:hypothetical protein
VRLLLSIACVCLFPAIVGGSPRQVKWEDLGFVTGKTVSISMPGGTVVTGQTTAVEADALVMHVKKTSDAKAYPKGPLRVPRATLRTLELNTKGHKWRVIGTVVGTIAGLGGGTLAAIGINGGILNENNPPGAAAAAIGITAVGVTAGYLAGNAGDRRTILIEILP